MPELNVIDKPSLKSFLRKTAEWSFTSVIWGLWLYLLLPLVNIILWLLGIHYFFVEVIEKAGYLILLDLLKNTGLSILVVFGIIRIWGYYNYLRFRKKERRKTVSITPTHQISAFFQMPYDQVLSLQSEKEVICDLGDDGKTLTVAHKSP
jgi:poly-beta-1,6-N-acetyl-D-glucosamine biosynthesis protein PgaD